MTEVSTVRTTAVITVALAMAVALSGCSPVSPPATVPAASTSATDGADVTLMDTGPYATTPSPPFGTAGFTRDPKAIGERLEARRIAEYTVGPWQVDNADNALTIPAWRLNPWEMGTVFRNDLFPLPFTTDNPVALQVPPVMGDVSVPDRIDRATLGKHRMVGGFSTFRASPQAQQSPKRAGDYGLPSTNAEDMQSALQTLVFAFPDPPAAAAAAADLAASANGKPIEIPGHPDARAVSYEVPGPDKFEPATELVYTPIGVNSTVVQSVSTFGTVVLMVVAQAPILGTREFVTTGRFGRSPEQMVASALGKQESLIRDYVPTPADKLADLPVDPSGWLLARTLDANDSPGTIGGVWEPNAWLHFEDDPIAAAALFADAGVDWVAQAAATVYQTRDAEAGAIMLAKMIAALSATPSVEAASAVPGLPQARCFRQQYVNFIARAREGEIVSGAPGAAPPGSPGSWLRVGWPFKCVAATDRWVFTVYAESMSDAAQRISAQYRILARR
jgi:hypothetical protein